jgi:hypothetical protein
MIDTGVIYRNPVVPDGFYYMKVVHKDTEPANYLFPKMLIRLVPLPDYEMPAGTTFHVILHPGAPSYWHYKNFYGTFMLGEYIDDLQEAIGQWGSVKVQQMEYNGTLLSSVKFIYQPLEVRRISWRISKLERQKMEKA